MRFYLTTPIYYVNSTPHIGHAYTTIAADIVVRHSPAARRRDVLPDGHGRACAQERPCRGGAGARRAGRSSTGSSRRLAPAPRRASARRPTSSFARRDEGHKRFVQEFLQRIYDNGDIYEGTYSGLYCVGCEAFYTEAEPVDGKCPDHGTRRVDRGEELVLPALRLPGAAARALRRSGPTSCCRASGPTRRGASSSGGLQDFSVSRAGQPWGIPVPWDPSQVVYVWVDALINYLSALTYARPGEDLRERFWPAVRHLMAKDILRFHCVYLAGAAARRPATRCRSRSSSTATCCSTTARSRRRSAT